MADDLIPPPSPAGREPTRAPEPPPEEAGRGASEGGSLWRDGDAGGTRLAEQAAALRAGEGEPAAVPAASATPPEKLPPSPYRARFGFLAGALLGLAVAAIALTVVLVGGAGSDGAPKGWSAWKPAAGDGVGAAREIANHVAPKYRLGTGDQLVLVQAGPLEISDLPLSVALRSAPQGGDIDFLEGRGVLYTLNGLGPRGSIKQGDASPQRHQLLRREALELALYTFRYAKDVDLVVTLLPPPPPDEDEPATAPQPPTQAILYRPGDLRRQLEAPLRSTIPLQTPRPETIPVSEGKRIDDLTLRNLFLASFQQAQDARAFLVLDRPTP